MNIHPDFIDQFNTLIDFFSGKKHYLIRDISWWDYFEFIKYYSNTKDFDNFWYYVIRDYRLRYFI